MSDPDASPRRTFPLKWALLLLLVPAALYVGHLAASAPVPPAAATDTAVHAAPSGAAEAGATPARPLAGAPEASTPEAGAPPELQVGDGRMHWLPLDQAFTEAERTHKPVLIDFTADWCPSCQRLRQTVFENPAYAGAIDAAVIPVSIVDRVREQGSNSPDVANLQMKFGVTAFPTLVVMSPATGKVQRVVGAGTPDQARDWIVGAAQSVQ